MITTIVKNIISIGITSINALIVAVLSYLKSSKCCFMNVEFTNTNTTSSSSINTFNQVNSTNIIKS